MSKTEQSVGLIVIHLAGYMSPWPVNSLIYDTVLRIIDVFLFESVQLYLYC